MELLEGETLRERITSCAPLGAELTWRIAEHAARALEALWRAGFVHRDVKPSNLYLDSSQEAVVCKLVDFGVALGKHTDETAGTFVGTPRYVSPEQARDAASADVRSDLFSLALVVVECLTARSPYGAVNGEALAQSRCVLPAPSTLGPVPAGFDAWFARATQADPACRFQSVGAFLAALEPVLADAGDGGLLRDQPTATRDEASRRSGVLTMLLAWGQPALAWGVGASVVVGLVLGWSALADGEGETEVGAARAPGEIERDAAPATPGVAPSELQATSVAPRSAPKEPIGSTAQQRGNVPAGSVHKPVRRPEPPARAEHYDPFEFRK